MVHIVAGRTIEGEAGHRRVAFLVTQQRDRETPTDMRGIEQGAIGTVVDVEFGAATALHPDDDGAIFRRQRAARFAPEFRRIADRQAFEATVDRVEIIFERNRLHTRIDRWEAAADIDDVDRDRRIDDRRADALDRVAIGLRAHRLATDMEADAERVGGLALLRGALLCLLYMLRRRRLA